MPSPSEDVTENEAPRIAPPESEITPRDPWATLADWIERKRELRAFDAAAADAGYVVSDGRWALADEDLPYLLLAYSLIVAPDEASDADVEATRSKLWRFGWHQGGIAAACQESQRLGDFADIRSAALISVALDAVKARVGSQTLNPDPAGIAYADLFYLDLWIDWQLVTVQGRLGIPKWIRWQWVLAVGSACVREMEQRLARHPNSKRVLNFRDGDEAALRELLLAAEREWRGRRNNALLPEALQDELIESQPADLWTVIAQTTAKRASPNFDDLPPESQRLEMLRLAVDGAYDAVPQWTALRTIDQQRKALTKERGEGVIPDSLTPPPDDAPESEWKPHKAMLWEESRTRSATSDLSAVLSDFSRQSATHPEIVGDLGKADRTWRLLRGSYERSKQPAEELGASDASEPFDPIGATQKEIAEHLGVSETTAREDRDRLRLVIRRYVQPRGGDETRD